MSKRNTTPKPKLRRDEALVAAVAKEFKSGATLPATIKKLGSEKIHLVSPVYWKLAGESRPFSAEVRENAAKLRSAVISARKSGERREIVAARANISVARVREIEGKKPVWTGRGTKRHLGA